MIVYNLACAHDHRFEGWFASVAEFERQQNLELVCCPVCNSLEVRRMPVALAIGSGKGGNKSAMVADLDSAAQLPSSANKVATSSNSRPIAVNEGSLDVLSKLPDSPLAALQTLVQAVIESSEDVGSQFAAEARRIHYDEAPARPIRGQTTADEFEALQDEGIELLRLPILKKESLN
jgi:hypothetical protein